MNNTNTQDKRIWVADTWAVILRPLVVGWSYIRSQANKRCNPSNKFDIYNFFEGCCATMVSVFFHYHPGPCCFLYFSGRLLVM